MSLYIRSMILFASVFLCVNLQGQIDFPNGTLSTDTLIGGETNEFYAVLECNEISAVELFLTPVDYIDRDLCPDCNEDSFLTDYLEKYNDTIVFARMNLPPDAYPCRYKLTYLRDISPRRGTLSEWVWVISKPYIIEQPEDVISCKGEQAVFTTNAYTPDEIIYQWYHNNDPVEGATGRELKLENVSESNTGSYVCVLANEFGKDTTETAMLSLYPYPETIGIPDGLSRLCMGSGNTSYTIPDEPLVHTYNWVLVPGDAGTITTDGPGCTIHWNEEFAGEAKLFVETVLENCPGPNSDTLSILVTGPIIKPEICIVGTDLATNKYRIVWNKINDESIVSYIIYRESNQAGEFLELATVPADEFSVYIDESSSPDILPYSYKMSYIDTCGNVSEMSDTHKTIHLTANVGTSGESNLSWSPYEGFAFLTYKIYRGSDPDSLTLFQEVSSNVTSYTDDDPPDGYVYYRILISRDGQCIPGKKSANDYSIAMSNIADFTTSIDADRFNANIRVLPNPADREIKIISTGLAEDAVVLIFSLTGSRIASYRMHNGALIIPVGQLDEGLYILKMEDKGTVINRKLLISH
jgi:hypothetical protein